MLNLHPLTYEVHIYHENHQLQKNCSFKQFFTWCREWNKKSHETQNNFSSYICPVPQFWVASTYGCSYRIDSYQFESPWTGQRMGRTEAHSSSPHQNAYPTRRGTCMLSWLTLYNAQFDGSIFPRFLLSPWFKWAIRRAVFTGIHYSIHI